MMLPQDYAERRASKKLYDDVVAENAKLRAALKPFADTITNNEADDREVLFEECTEGGHDLTYAFIDNLPSLGDFRRAHDLLYPPKLP